MAQLLVRDLSSDAVERLKAMARRRGRSLQAEVKEILEDVAIRDLRREEFVRYADWARKQNGPQTTDSVDLIREDRDRDRLRP